jgi:hypothetical protein
VFMKGMEGEEKEREKRRKENRAEERVVVQW